jgi:glyoxalase family protein
VEEDDGQRTLRDHLLALDCAVTAVHDRRYFRSIYFRIPGGVLFEAATDGPGFAVDEPAGALGARIMLPPQYEAARARIESTLPPLD